MEIDDDRMVELDPWSIRVHQQLMAGYPIDVIKAQFESAVDITPKEVSWIMDRAKIRYNGYYNGLKISNREDSKWMLAGGPVLIFLVILALSIFGWSEAGRQNGRIVWAVLVGVGVFIYGAWCWIDAEPDGRRSDIDKLCPPFSALTSILPRSGEVPRECP